MENKIITVDLPPQIGRVFDFVPTDEEAISEWILLNESGDIIQFNCESSEWVFLAKSNIEPELDHEPWCDHLLKQRISCSPDRKYIAILNDYGKFGQIISLESGEQVCKLSGGDYYSETVPFSFDWILIEGKALAIHRTDWNRLDITDPSTGEVLTNRSLTSYTNGQEQPQHYLDYFHGSIYVSPDYQRVADDGWVWHPVGVVTTWNIKPWVEGNVWESDDGSSKVDLCMREYYWDNAVTWITNDLIAIEGIGDDEEDIVKGVRIFDLSIQKENMGPEDGSNLQTFTIEGPGGRYFSDGEFLFSADEMGLARWDIREGVCTALVKGFSPSQFSRARKEFAQILDNRMLILKL